MDTKSDNTNNSDTDAEETPATEEAEERTAYDAVFDADDVVAEKPKPPRLPLFASLAALALSVVAVAGVLYLLRAPTGTETGSEVSAGDLRAIGDVASANESAISEVRETVQPIEQAVATIEERIARLAADDGAAAADLDALERRFRQQADLVDSLPGRVASIERAVSTLRGVSAGSREAWLLAQAEYFLQIGNAEVELARNPGIAEKALEMADERLVAVGDPGLTDVRRALSAELRTLRSIEMPDIAGTTVTLASLSRVVDSLPIRRQLLTKRPEDESETGPTGGSEGEGTARAMATLREAFSDVVSIRRTDEAARPLIAPEAVYFLRTNLALQLQAARLALLTGEQQLFQQSLEDAASWLEEYYDTDSTSVRDALETINEIRDEAIVGDLPDISESLRLLRQYIAFREANPPSGEDGNEPVQ